MAPLRLRHADSDLHRSLEQKVAQFLEVDLAVGLTFATIAIKSKDPKRRQRNHANARKAFDVITSFLPRAKLNPQTAVRLIAGLDRLRMALQHLDAKKALESLSRQERL